MNAYCPTCTEPIEHTVSPYPQDVRCYDCGETWVVVGVTWSPKPHEVVGTQPRQEVIDSSGYQAARAKEQLKAGTFGDPDGQLTLFGATQ